VAHPPIASPDDSALLQLDAVDVFLGKAQILYGLSLRVDNSESVVLLGRNGAGKTTTLKSIIGFVIPRMGTISFRRTPIHRLPPHQRSTMGLGYVPENRRIFTQLTVVENLEVGRQPPRDDRDPWCKERLFELFPNLWERRHQKGGLLSGGEQQMLAIARTLMGNPQLVLFDEICEGLAPIVVSQLVDAIKTLKDQGVSLLLAEQNLNFAERICDRAYILHQGSIRHGCTIEDLSLEKYAEYIAV
jgi:branched-chain amino acid transport system ATP-binding protein